MHQVKKDTAPIVCAFLTSVYLPCMCYIVQKHGCF